jgi:FAD/FMN-containing dehydrogenase
LITEQTIAGAISTATHGSGRHSLSHYMQEIRTAAYDAETGKARIHVWTSGDELRAARCAVGCLGIILSVTFRCVPKYLVSDRLERCRNLDKVLAGEQDYPLQQFYLVPWLWDWFAQRRKTAVDEPRSRYADLYRRYWYLGIDVGYHLFIKLLVTVLRSPRLVRFFYRWLMAPAILKNVTVVDHSDRALIMEHELFRHLEIEIFVPARHLREAADFVRDVLRAFDSPRAILSGTTEKALHRIGMQDALVALRGTFTQHYVVTFRRVLPDDALIAMTADSVEPWYAISFITYAEPRDAFRGMAKFLLETMVRLYGARPHWGKYCPLTVADGQALYPRLEDFRRIARRVDPQGVFQNEFVGRVLGFKRPADASSP